MDLKEEYKELQAKIAEVTKEIIIVKDDLVEMYDSDNLIPILPHRKRRMSLKVKDLSDKVYTKDALKCCFYQTYMTAREKHNSTNVVVTFPTEDETVYGVELIVKKDTFTIEKICLPLYILPQKLFTTMKDINIEKLSSSLNLIYRCIIANQNRMVQMDRLKEFDNKIGYVSISPCSQFVSLRTIIMNRNNDETSLHITIMYNPSSFRPTTIEVQFEKDILQNKEKLKTIKRISIFAKNELLEAYKTFFKL